MATSQDMAGELFSPGPEILGKAELILGIFDSLPDGCVVVDNLGRIYMVNEQAALMTGYPREELKGQLVEILVPEERRNLHSTHRIGYMHDPRTRTMGADLELAVRRSDGTTFDAEIALGPIVSRHGIFILVTIRRRRER